MSMRNREKPCRMVKLYIHKQFLSPDHVARHAADAETKLYDSHCHGERKTWDWDKYIALHKEQHAIMESLTDYGYSGMGNGKEAATFSVASRALSWRQRSICLCPTREMWHRF